MKEKEMTKMAKRIEEIAEGHSDSDEVTAKHKSKLHCVWNISWIKCSDDVDEAHMFSEQITVPICGNHLNIHKKIMFMHSSGEDIEEIMQIDNEDVFVKRYEELKAANPDIEETC